MIEAYSSSPFVVLSVLFITIFLCCQLISARPTCWLPALCGPHTRYSYSFPTLNQTEIRIHFFEEKYIGDKDDNEIDLIMSVAYVPSLCFQLELKQVYDIDLTPSSGGERKRKTDNDPNYVYPDEVGNGIYYRFYDFNESTSSHLRTPIHCYDDLHTEDLALLVITLPYALVPGEYDMHMQMTYVEQRYDSNGMPKKLQTTEATSWLTKTLTYFIFPRPQPTLPGSRVSALAPSYGSFVRNHFFFNLYNNYQALLASPETRPYVHDILTFNVHGLHQYLLPAYASVASSKGGPKIEAGSWFFEIMPMKLPDTLNNPSAVDQVIQDLSLNVPDAYVSALNGEFIGPVHPQVGEKVNFFYGHAAEGYVEVVLNDEELAHQRLFVRDHESYVSLLPSEGQMDRQQLTERTKRRIEQELDGWEKEMTSYYGKRLAAARSKPKHRQVADRRKINICIFGSGNMDGQKRIWLQQAESLDQSKFQFIWLLAHGDGSGVTDLKTKTTSIYYHLNRLPQIKVSNNTSNGYALSFEKLNEIPNDSFVTAAMVWEYNTTKLYQYIHQRFERANGDIERLSPPFVRDFYQTFVDMFETNKCDIAVYGNARGYNTDVFINDAARYLRIPTVTELLNLYLEPDILPDAIIAPSHHSLLHESIQGPIATKVKETGIKPLGFVIAPSMDPDHFNPEPFRLHVPFIPPKNCDVSMTDAFRTKITQEDFNNAFYKHAPCVLIGFVARISGGK